MRIIIVFAGVLLLTTWSCNNEEAKEQVSAKEYNDKMIAIQQKVDEAFVDVIEVIYEIDHDKMDKTLEQSLDITDSAIKEVEEKDSSFDSGNYKSQMKKLLEAYISVLEQEFAQIIEIYKLPDEEYSQEHKEEVSKLFDSALTTYSIAIADFRDFQERFAKAHKLELQE